MNYMRCALGCIADYFLPIGGAGFVFYLCVFATIKFTPTLMIHTAQVIQAIGQYFKRTSASTLEPHNASMVFPRAHLHL